MNLVLKRQPARDSAILGELFVDGTFECYTLERQDVKIPTGTYRVVITPSTRFGRLLPLLEGVPGRSGIRIHPLNFPQESEGCIGVGKDHSVTSISHSRDAMQALQSRIAAALANHEDVWITVEPFSLSPLSA